MSARSGRVVPLSERALNEAEDMVDKSSYVGESHRYLASNGINYLLSILLHLYYDGLVDGKRGRSRPKRKAVEGIAKWLHNEKVATC